MAKRLSVKEMLEAARQAGPAKPADPNASTAPVETPETTSPEGAAAESAPASTPAASEPAQAESAPPTAPAPLGRPLTLKEKLAAARAGGAPAAPKAAPAPAPAAEASAAEPTGEAVAEPAPAPAAPAPAAPLGRPLTLKEKLAAARGGAAPTAAAAATPAATAAAKGETAAKAAAPRTLPPLDKITDPKDLAEALRQSGAKKAKEAAAAAAKNAPAASAAPAAKPVKESKPQTVLPKPTKAAATATATAAAPSGVSRRGFLLGPLFVSWAAIGWASFVAGCSMFTVMLGRFMFPNVLAEPPSTIKVGLPSNFEPEEVNERFKAEWGFWIVRSTRYNGEDIVYALQSVCTHLGCPPNWLGGEQKFKCPCHGSGFYISGVNFEGPAPRPLERFKVTLADDGQMVVDKSQKFQQELGQWSDPESYITA